MSDNTSYKLLVRVVNSFTPCGFVNGLQKQQYDALNAALKYIHRIEGMRKKKEDHPAIAQALKNKGHTIREIASILGYKHPGSISHLLSRK